ncbi:MAG: hypothetical protein H6810_04050 [Phycisphaeraceae bacterium]|nr:MAG: hypothetical protein H6810_04050 [Phycisphaeraceae bacterium]
MKTMLLSCALAASMFAPLASAQTPVGGALDYLQELDAQPGVPIVLQWDTGFRWPFGRRPWISDSIEIEIDIQVFSAVTHGMAWGFLDSIGDEPNATAQITTVYGHDANHGEFEPRLAGLSPANPEYVPVSDEVIETRQGGLYFASEAMTVPIFQLPELLPGHDLSMVDFSDPFTVVHVFRTYAPMNEIWYECPSDMNNDGLHDLFDIQAFVTGFINQQWGVDFDFNGVFDLHDIVAFVESFNSGC